MTTLTPALRRQYRERLAASRAFGQELADREKSIAALAAKPSFDPWESEFMDALNGEDEVERWDLPRTRSSAIYHQSATYSTGRLCIDGHDSPRWTSSGRCVLCQAAGDAERAEFESRRSTAKRMAARAARATRKAKAASK